MSATSTHSCDVLICGGGLAGLTLARQLCRRLPQLDLLVVDRLRRPLPVAAFKVGESSVEIGAHYLTDVLGLRDYFSRAHLRKHGLRFFFGRTDGPFEERPEVGASYYPDRYDPAPHESLQIDRGVLENDLRQMVVDSGVALWEGASVDRIEIDGLRGHRVAVADAEQGGRTRSVRCRWLVDASGRRRLLAKKLGLGRKLGARHSAVWFRVRGRVDVSDLVPRGCTAWHDRVEPAGARYYSTNHLCGPGRWVWLIPLPSGHTSIGIVAADASCPFERYASPERALRWLREHEPLVAGRIDGLELIDFGRMRNFTHLSSRLFSEQRWLIVGEAGIFSDPFLSSGADLIATENCLATELIDLDCAGRLEEFHVDRANLLAIFYATNVTSLIQAHYRFFGHPYLAGLRMLWNQYLIGTLGYLLHFQGIFQPGFVADDERLAALTSSPEVLRSLTLVNRVERLFEQWSQQARGGARTFRYLELWGCRGKQTSSRLVRAWASGQRIEPRSPGELRDEICHRTMLLEEVAQLLFLLMVADVCPESLEALPCPYWVNLRAASLEPARWRSDGLFEAQSPPRSLTELLDDLLSWGFDLPHEVARLVRASGRGRPAAQPDRDPDAPG